ncbi:hypothetical protein [Paraburkholderia sp. BL17N1]|uniref:hypothetical protein n=1 Tax=Paraburkholderia sp. BL17N1 TaxID=1938798 RepID=UPI000EB4A770|nr:hypothetical protein [Paraburkholderia sp. BL17N1]RKR46279.1 hypothetical protein B0G82_3961 [Paraburkholderia sp. BL17N1]
MKVVVAMCLSAFALLGCQQKPDEAVMAECWSQDTKSEFLKLARRDIEGKIADIIRGGGETVDDAVKKRIDNSLDVTTSNFYVAAVDRNADSIRCGAEVAMTYTGANGKKFNAAGGHAEMDVYRSEGGKEYSMPGLPLMQLVSDATKSN